MMSNPLKNFVKGLVRQSTLGRSVAVNGYHSVEQIKGIIGYQMLSWVARVENIKRDDFNWSKNGRWSLIDSLLRAGLIRQATINNDLAQLETYHRNFWQSERGFHYHSDWQPAIMEIFLKHYASLVTDIATMLKASPDYTTVCEIGTGTGYLLEHLAEQLPSIHRFIGIDLSPETTEDNIRRFKNPKLEFATGDGSQWVQDHGQSNWIFITNGGVLEYFHQQSLETLLHYIGHELTPAIFVAIEPISVTHNLKTETKSKPLGTEFSYSHNYPHHFRQAGFYVKQMDYQEDHFAYQMHCFVASTDECAFNTLP